MHLTCVPLGDNHSQGLCARAGLELVAFALAQAQVGTRATQPSPVASFAHTLLRL